MFDMKRREFVTLVGDAAVAWPLTVRAQQKAKVVRIGFLGLGPASAWSSRLAAFRAGLCDLGWIEGKNVVIEFRWADSVDQLPALAEEPVCMQVTSSSRRLRPWLGPPDRRPKRFPSCSLMWRVSPGPAVT
jgi:putative ABC transport system substrate-binding protein